MLMNGNGKNRSEPNPAAGSIPVISWLPLSHASLLTTHILQSDRTNSVLATVS